MYGDNQKTAAGVPEGSYIEVSGTIFERQKSSLKTSIDAFSGAVSDNMELKK
jgi:hypothetical protein